MMTIWKYPLEIMDTQFLELPVGAEILSVQVQNGQLVCWAIFDKLTARIEQRIVYIFGTGNPIRDNDVKGKLFLGTVQMGLFVWHVFVSRNRG